MYPFICTIHPLVFKGYTYYCHDDTGSHAAFYLKFHEGIVKEQSIDTVNYRILEFIGADKIWRNCKILLLARLNLTNLAHVLLQHPLSGLILLLEATMCMKVYRLKLWAYGCGDYVINFDCCLIW